MRKKSLSTLGFIMEHLNIQTVSMASSLHVDASLISKWKSGSRTLSSKSIYFDDVIDYILDKSTDTIHQNLTKVLLDLYPQEEIEDELQLESLLRKALSSTPQSYKTNGNPIISGNSNTITTNFFEENVGRKEAINNMLTYAENMKIPGEFLFVDNEDFNWLLDDKEYAINFSKRMENLIHKGFHATFVINYSVYNSYLVELFDACSPLIFHRNINWYCHEYYDMAIVQYSFFILNHAISLIGFSSKNAVSSTMIFTDNNLVIRHEAMARNYIKHSRPLFTYFNIFEINKVLQEVSLLRKRGTFYSCLPYPTFISVHKPLLQEILTTNKVDEKTVQKCLNINQTFTELIKGYLPPYNYLEDNFIFIFQLEKLLERANGNPFESNSLSITCQAPITITPMQYATELRQLASDVLTYRNLQIVLVSKKDNISLPSINCWCKQNIWMIQMNREGLRLSNEYSIVNASSSKWEHCLRAVPTERKNPAAVAQFFNELATKIELKSTTSPSAALSPTP